MNDVGSRSFLKKHLCHSWLQHCVLEKSLCPFSFEKKLGFATGIAMPVKQEMPADESSVPTVPSGQKPLKKTKVKITDFSFANKLEDCRLVRELLRDGGRLIRWESQEKANVISLSALGLNSKVMCMLADHHCSSTSSVKPPSIAFLKAQVGIGLANTKEKQSIRYKKSLKADINILLYIMYMTYCL